MTETPQYPFGPEDEVFFCHNIGLRYTTHSLFSENEYIKQVKESEPHIFMEEGDDTVISIPHERLAHFLHMMYCSCDYYINVTLDEVLPIVHEGVNLQIQMFYMTWSKPSE